MKQYMNENFNLCLSTQMFVLFDLYIIRYTDEKNNAYVNNLQNDFVNNDINLTEFNENNNLYIFNQIVTDLSQSLEISEYNLNYKPINNISIDTNNVYKQTEPESTKTLIALQVKKFDDINYIVPNMLSLDLNYLTLVDRYIELDNFFEYLNDTKEQDNLLTNFSNVTNI